MALIDQVIPLSLGIGIDTKTDPKQVVSTKLLALQNAIFGTGGEFNKRNGFQQLYPAQVASSGNAVASFQDQLVTLDGFNLNAYSETQSKFNVVGEKTCVDISADPVLVTQGAAAFADLAFMSGLYAVITSGSQVIVIDSTTGQKILNTTIPVAGTLSTAKVQVLGTKFIFVYSTASTIGYAYVDSSAPSVLSAPVTLQTNYNSGHGFFDCRTINSKLVFVYNDNSNETSCFYLDSSLVKSSTFQVNVNGIRYGIFSDLSNNVWVCNSTISGGNNLVNYFILNPGITATILNQTNVDTLTSLQATSILNVGGIYNGTNGVFYYSMLSATAVDSLDYTKTAIYSVAGSPVSAASFFLRSLTTYSRAFTYSGTIYLMMCFNSSLQSTFFLVDQNGVVVAKVAQGDATLGQNAPAVDVFQIDSTTFTMSFTSIVLSNGNAGSDLGGTTYGQSGVSQLFIDFNSPVMTTTLGKNLLMTGGILTLFDGANAVEHGFNAFPTIDNAGFSTSPPGSINAGTYGYAATYEWTDDQGQVHRSAPAFVNVVVTGSGNSVTLVCETLRVTQKKNVYVVFWRTTANGTQYFQASPTIASGNAVPNDTTADTVTFVDTLADGTIQGNLQLYTNGGEFENTASPATSIIWQYQNRLMCVYSEQSVTIGFSKQVVGGQFSSPVEFNDSFTILAPENDGGITAGIQMDDKCIIFKKNTIYYMVGEGPSSNGQNNNFSTPLVISTDCGCIDKKSVVLMPDGVMFKSLKGIYLLDRSLQVHYIGADVESYNAISITSSQMLESVNQIRFTLDSGVAIVYDYYYKQWATFTNLNAIDSCIFQGDFTYIQPGGLVFQETPGVYTDHGNFIPISFTTSWFSFAKIQGFQRAKELLILGEYKSPHTLQVQLSVNFDPTVVQTASVPVLSSLVPYQNRVFIVNQQCQSYRLTVTEQQSSSFGEGLSLSALTFLVGAKKGLYKVPSAVSYG